MASSAHLMRDQLHSLEVVASKTDGMVRLVEDIVTLDTTALKSMNRAPEDLRVLLEQAVEASQASARSRSLTVEIEVPDSPQVALVDRFRIGQVIDNLLGNAMKFSSDGGHVYTRVEDKGDVVRVAIEDKGIGIAPEAQNLIFDKYYQAEESNARYLRGIGIGLTIAKEIIDAHEGIIGVKSVPDVGSTFYFEVDKF